MAKSPLNQKKGEIRDASEILGDQPGYNPKTNTVVQAGRVNMPTVGSGHGVGTAMGIATGAFTLGYGAYQAIKNKIRNKKRKNK